MKQNIELLQGLIDQAVKSGLMANLETAAAVHNAWKQIKAAAMSSEEVLTPSPAPVETVPEK